MDKGSHTSETVAAYSSKAMERGELYSIPQPMHQLAWVAKRAMPNTFYKTIGWLYRNQIVPFAS
jgi:short-subunit dehydrogenase